MYIVDIFDKFYMYFYRELIRACHDQVNKVEIKKIEYTNLREKLFERK